MSSPEATPTGNDRDAVVEALREALRSGELREVIVEAATEALNSGEITLDVREAAKALGCGVRFLLDGCNQHGFPYIDMGKSKRFGPRELREIQEMLRVPAQPSRLAAARRRSAAEKSAGKKPAARRSPKPKADTADESPMELALAG
jgi:hypothetical protein